MIFNTIAEIWQHYKPPRKLRRKSSVRFKSRRRLCVSNGLVGVWYYLDKEWHWYRHTGQHYECVSRSLHTPKGAIDIDKNDSTAIDLSLKSRSQ